MKKKKNKRKSSREAGHESLLMSDTTMGKAVVAEEGIVGWGGGGGGGGGRLNFYKIMRIERLVFKTPDGGIAYLGSGRMYLYRLYRCKFIALCFLFVLIDLDWVILWSTSTTSDLVTKGEKVRGYLAIMLFWKKNCSKY